MTTSAEPSPSAPVPAGSPAARDLAALRALLAEVEEVAAALDSRDLVTRARRIDRLLAEIQGGATRPVRAGRSR